MGACNRVDRDVRSTLVQHCVHNGWISGPARSILCGVRSDVHVVLITSALGHLMKRHDMLIRGGA